MKEYIVIFITTPSDEEAQRIANALVEEKKAACVNILRDLRSLFWWEGKVDSASEALLIVKTKERFLDSIVKLVKGLHTYTVPEIIAIPIIGGNPEYLRWIDESLEGP